MDYTVGQIPALASGKIDEMWRQIMTSTVPFLRFKHGRLEHEASGVLMRIADSAFVLTASHALKQLLDGEISMLLAHGFAGFRWDFSLKSTCVESGRPL